MALVQVTLKLTSTEFRVICSALRDYYRICDSVVTGGGYLDITTTFKGKGQRQIAQERERVKNLREKITPEN